MTGQTRPPRDPSPASSVTRARRSQTRDAHSCASPERVCARWPSGNNKAATRTYPMQAAFFDSGGLAPGSGGLHAAWRRQEPPRPVWLAAWRSCARSTTRPEVSPSRAGRRLPEHPIKGAALDTRGRWLGTQILPLRLTQSPAHAERGFVLFVEGGHAGQLAVWISQSAWLRPIVAIHRGLSRPSSRRPKQGVAAPIASVRIRIPLPTKTRRRSSYSRSRTRAARARTRTRRTLNRTTTAAPAKT